VKEREKKDKIYECSGWTYGTIIKQHELTAVPQPGKKEKRERGERKEQHSCCELKIQNTAQPPPHTRHRGSLPVHLASQPTHFTTQPLSSTTSHDSSGAPRTNVQSMPHRENHIVYKSRAGLLLGESRV
jgi:hypothetical protein